MIIDGIEYVTAQDAARRLNVHYGYVRLIIAQGKLPSIKLGTNRLIAVSAIAAYRVQKPDRKHSNK